MTSAISTVSIGAAGLITDDEAMLAWVERKSPPPTIAVLGHTLQRDPYMVSAGLLDAYVAQLGNAHALIATRYDDGAWRVTLVHFAGSLPSVSGIAETIDEAAARMLVMADQRRDELGIEVVLRLAVIGGAR